MSFQEGNNKDQTVVGDLDQKNATKDLYETIRKSENLKHLASIVDAAGLQVSLSAPKLLTLFAPVDEAVEKALNGPESDRDRAQEFMQNHIVTGRFTTADLRLAKAVKTAGGATLSLETEGRVTTVNGASLTRTDIACTNGIIHMVDCVLTEAGCRKVLRGGGGA
jgi:uncharacterized surface protein with fasciclin (FAS1) repeats